MGPRVLLGDLEPIVRLGMATVLRENGAEIVDVAPDAVVLDIADGSSRALAARIRRDSPGTTVVLWARDEEVMEVLSAAAPRRVLSPGVEELARAVLAAEA
jgi:DNA-binding NarL/FixJ family response regulator